MDTVKKQWEELILAMECEEESTRHKAGAAYTARGGEDPEFKEKDEQGRWWKAWTVEIRRLASQFEAKNGRRVRKPGTPGTRQRQESDCDGDASTARRRHYSGQP